MFDTKNKKGLVYNKLTYQKYGKKDLAKAMENINLSASVDCNLQPLTEEEVKAAMLFFRTCIVQNEKETLKFKLKQTIAAREELIKKKGVKFFEVFPFYFIDPELVI